MSLSATARAALLLALAAPAAAAQETPRRIDTSTVRPGVTLLAAPPDGNLLVVRGTEGTLLVDALAPGLEALADSAVRAAAGGPPRWVVNTHYHFDHIGANARFAAAGAATIAHAEVPRLARRDTTIAVLDWDLDPADPASIPATLVQDSLRIDLGGETARIIHLPAAHTAGDLVVRIERANVVHTGDLVEFGAYPFIDWWGGGSYDGLVKAVDRVLALGDDTTTFVPGHGPVLTRADVVEYRDMLQTVGTQVRAAIRDGVPIDSLVARNITTQWDGRHGGPRHGQRFVRLLHLEFTRAKQAP